MILSPHKNITWCQQLVRIVALKKVFKSCFKRERVKMLFHPLLQGLREGVKLTVCPLLQISEVPF